jgi:hypothetical protein
MTKADFLSKNPHLFSLTELNFIIKHKDKNGFADAVRQLSYKKVLVHEPSVLLWIEGKK